MTMNTEPTAPPPRRRISRPLLAALAALSVVTALGAVGVLWMRTDHGPATTASDRTESNATAAGHLAAPPVYCAGDWPSWRGPAGDNCAPQASCPTTWSEEQNIAWRTRLPGKGHSSPVVVGDRVFVTAAEETPRRVLALAFDAKTGKELWRQTVAEGTFRPIHTFNSHATPTPTCDGRRLYVAALVDGSVQLAALSVSDGKLLWSTDCGPCTAKWGLSGSPAYWRGLIYLVVDNPEGGWIAAFGAEHGEEIWRQTRPPAQEGSYSSPLVAAVHGTEEVVVAGAETITAYKPDSGATAWSYQGIPSCCVSTVVVAGDLCISAGGWPDRRLTCVRLNQKSDDGEVRPEKLWEATNSSEVPYVPTPLCHDGKLYVVNDQGVVTCREAASGTILWKRRLEGNFQASPVLVGDRLLLANREGVSSLLDVDSGKVIAQNALSAGLHSSPTPSQALLYLRAENELYCIGEPHEARQNRP